MLKQCLNWPLCSHLGLLASSGLIMFTIFVNSPHYGRLFYSVPLNRALGPKIKLKYACSKVEWMWKTSFLTSQGFTCYTEPLIGNFFIFELKLHGLSWLLLLIELSLFFLLKTARGGMWLMTVLRTRPWVSGLKAIPRVILQHSPLLVSY
jgi:hypothetical protein